MAVVLHGLAFVLIGLSITAFIRAVVGFISPGRAGIPSRAEAGGSLLLSVILLSIGWSMLPDDPDSPTSTPSEITEAEDPLAPSAQSGADEAYPGQRAAVRASAAQDQGELELSAWETHVAWDEMEAGKYYQPLSRVDLWRAPSHPFPSSGMQVTCGVFKLEEIDRSNPAQHWYIIRWLMPEGSLPPCMEWLGDRTADLTGWVKPEDFKESGAVWLNNW